METIFFLSSKPAFLIKQTPFARCCSRRNRAAAAATGREADLLQSIGRSRVRARPAEGRRHAGAPQPRQRRGPYGHPAERWRCSFMFSFSFCTYFTDLVPIKFSLFTTCFTEVTALNLCICLGCRFFRIVFIYLFNHLSSSAVPRLIELCRSPTERNNSDSVLVACLVGVQSENDTDTKTQNTKTPANTKTGTNTKNCC